MFGDFIFPSHPDALSENEPDFLSQEDIEPNQLHTIQILVNGGIISPDGEVLLTEETELTPEILQAIQVFQNPTDKKNNQLHVQNSTSLVPEIPLQTFGIGAINNQDQQVTQSIELNSEDWLSGIKDAAPDVVNEEDEITLGFANAALIRAAIANIPEEVEGISFGDISIAANQFLVEYEKELNSARTKQLPKTSPPDWLDEILKILIVVLSTISIFIVNSILAQSLITWFARKPKPSGKKKDPDQEFKEMGEADNIPEDRELQQEEFDKAVEDIERKLSMETGETIKVEKDERRRVHDNLQNADYDQIVEALEQELRSARRYRHLFPPQQDEE